MLEGRVELAGRAELEGRVALVTGGARGIGEAVARALAARGLAVAVTSRSAGDAAAAAGRLEAREVPEPTAPAGGGPLAPEPHVARGSPPSRTAELKAGSARAVGVALDVADPAAVARAVAEVERALGPIDVLVNNAGLAESAPLATTDDALWERHLRVNATGPFLLARALIPGMLARGWGRVVNVASLAGLEGAPYIAAYIASKHALVGLTRALAAEVRGKGVTVNAVCPGFVATEMTWRGARNIAARTGRSFEEAVAAMAALNPGGVLIEPEAVARACVELVADPARNGALVVLDGRQPRDVAGRPTLDRRDTP